MIVNGGGCHVTILAYASFHFQRLLQSGIFMIAVIECIKSFQMITLSLINILNRDQVLQR